MTSGLIAASANKHRELVISSKYSAEARPGRMKSRPGDQSTQLISMFELEFLELSVVKIP